MNIYSRAIDNKASKLGSQTVNQLVSQLEVVCAFKV